MLDNEIKKYFDGIEPENELVERMVAMSNDTKKEKRIKLSKKMIALIAAIVCLLVATTVTAAIVRVNNNEKGIVEINEFESFTLDFTKAQRSPQKLSSTDNDIVKALMDTGIRDVIIPTALVDEGYKIDNEINFHPLYTSGMYDLSNATENWVSLTVVQDISDEDMPGFWGTGDENSTGEIININGMDVVITYMGDETIGYASYIFYANGNTIYQITYHCGLEETSAKEQTLEFVKTLAQ